jgi:hypothetical protein
MVKAFSQRPAKTKRYRVTFMGPKGGYHHAMFTFKLYVQEGKTQPGFINRPAGLENMKQGGWIVHVVDWYDSTRRDSTRGEPNANLVYRLHKNDIYNSKLVKPGWRIVGAY